MYIVKQFPIGMLMANAYVISKGNHALVIDPGGSGAKVKDYIEQQGFIIDGIVLTHGHFDHMAGSDSFCKTYNCPLYMEEGDVAFLSDNDLNCATMCNTSVQIKSIPKILQIGKNTIGHFVFDVILAPGHTNGSCLLCFDKHMFSGDVLFKQGIGRCDLPQGSNSKMQNTLRMIQQLDSSFIVYPGHGECTTLHEELQSNPYF